MLLSCNRMYACKAIFFKCNLNHVSSISLSKLLCFSIKQLRRKEFVRLSYVGNKFRQEENCSIFQTLFLYNKRNALFGCHYSSQFHLHSSGHKLLSKDKQEWENLLSSEKKDNIEAIPVKVQQFRISLTFFVCCSLVLLVSMI